MKKHPAAFLRKGRFIRMSEILTGLKGQQYTITDHIKSGGEGGVYNTNFPEYVAKLYDTSKTNVDSRMAELEKKLTYMASNPIPTQIPDGTVIVTWPKDVLYRDGKFVGYIMPKVSGAKPIYMLNRGGKQANEVIPGYNWKTAVSVAVNLANIVEFLHSRNIVIGDMNSDNLLVYPNGFVVVIDTDSFDITDDASNIHYKCCVGTEEFLPPELQGRNLERKNVCFTKHSDEFALAVHIFQLLMNNMHPFNARVITDYKQSLPENSQNHNIMAGNCPFVRKIDGCTVPLGAPDINELLPNYLVNDFKRTFDYQLDPGDPSYMDELKRYEKHRTPVADWHRHLEQLAKDPDLVQCQSNPEHYYLASKGHCELCQAKKGVPMLASSTSSVSSTSSASSSSSGSSASSSSSASSTSSASSASPPARKIKSWVMGVAALIAVAIIAFVWYLNSPLKDYKTAMNNYDSGNYYLASNQFRALGDYKDSYEMWQESAYRLATNSFNNEFYASAAEQFKELGHYKDSYEMWQKSMIYYIAANYNYSNATTYEYLKTLIGLGYDYEYEYHELYDWRVERAFVNTDYSDTETGRYSISRSETWYAHFLIQGGTPEEKPETDLHVYLMVKQPGDSFYDDGKRGYHYQSYEDYNVYGGKDTKEYIVSDGWSFETPSTGMTGTMVFSLFNAETDELLGSATVEIVP